MTDRPTDRIADTLTALRTDIDRVPLADSGSVRRRGELRTRNQVIGTSLVVVALVAGAIGISAGLGGGDKVLAPPANPDTSTSAPQTESSPPSVDPPVTEVPKDALMAADDLAVPGLTAIRKGLTGVETLNPCLLGSDDLVAGDQVAFGTAGDVEASEMILTQRDAEAATRQVRGYSAVMTGCADREHAPAGVVVRDVAATPEQLALIDQLGPAAYVYYLEQDTLQSWVIGTTTANAGGYFAFDSGTFTLNQALETTVAARERMVATYGA